MATNRFDLEQKILNTRGGNDNIGLIIELAQSLGTDQRVIDALKSQQTMQELQFDSLFRCFEDSIRPAASGDNKYDDFYAWFDELESFSTRSERFYDLFDICHPDKLAFTLVAWLKGAFIAAREKNEA